MSETGYKDELVAEAQAFTSRIIERVDAGFVPDLRRAVHSSYFYKSFWRDPQFINLYLGWINELYLTLLSKYCPNNATILDVGCGAGYMSLELARNGYHVTGIDISKGCITNAKKMLHENPYTENFGSLDYKQFSLQEMTGEFDVVLFSVSLHHFPNVDEAVIKAEELLSDNGHLIFYEPCHERFLERDAATVALVRGLLSLTGNWFDPKEMPIQFDQEDELSSWVRDIKDEYFFERDKNEPDGQSPNDLEASGAEIIESVEKYFKKLERGPGFSFIYRLLGGLRGDQETVRKLADFIAAFDRMSVKNNFMNENHFFYVGKKRK